MSALKLVRPVGEMSVIDWKDSAVKETGEQIFPGEDVTRWKTGIHAWSAEKAAEYVRRLHQPLRQSLRCRACGNLCRAHHRLSDRAPCMAGRDGRVCGATEWEDVQ